MRIGGWAIVAALALTGCDREAPSERVTTVSTETPTAPVANVSGPEINVLAFGDSLFAGYGLADPGTQSYPSKLEAALRAGGRNVKIANAGVSGDTTAAGLQRLAFTLDSLPEKPDLVILELGGNDLLRGLPPEQTRANLAAMLEQLEKREIPVVLFGLKAPPNYGADWQRQFDGIYPALAKEYGAELVPFVTETVFTDPAMLQADRIHPTAQGVGVLIGATRDAVAKALPPPAG